MGENSQISTGFPRVLEFLEKYWNFIFNFQGPGNPGILVKILEKNEFVLENFSDLKFGTRIHFYFFSNRLSLKNPFGGSCTEKYVENRFPYRLL